MRHQHILLPPGAVTGIGSLPVDDPHVAFGLVPTLSVLDQIDPDALFIRWLVAVTGVMPIGAIARQTMITATCGLGLLSKLAAVSAFRLAHQLARRIAEVAEAIPLFGDNTDGEADIDRSTPRKSITREE
jgi:hypothetical protein